MMFRRAALVAAFVVTTRTGLAQDSPAVARPSEEQTVQIGSAPGGNFLRRLTTPFTPRAVNPVDFRNTGRLQSLIRAGQLYLTLDDAIALALENNLDIQLQRDNPQIARNDILRTKGGGLPRGVLLEIRELPAGVGGPGSPLLTTVGGVTPITSISSNSADLAPIQGQQVTLSVLGNTPLSVGSRIPQFDPTLTGSLNYQKQSIPETSVFLAGANPLQNNTIGANLGYLQGFSTGTTISSGFNSSRLNSNNARTDYNPYTSGNLGITLTQPLLQGFGIATNRRFISIAKNNLKISDQAFRQQVIDTLASVVRLYWDLVSLNEDLRVKRQALALSEKLFENNKAQVEVGTLAPIEVKRAQAEMARSRQDLANSTGLLLQQELILKTVLTRRGTADPMIRAVRLVPSDRIQVPAQEPLREAGSLVQAALVRRPDLAQAQLQITNSEIGLKGSRNALLPEMDLVGTIQNNGLAGQVNSTAPVGNAGPRNADPTFIGGGGTFLGQILGHNYPNYFIGVQLNIPLRNRIAQSDVIRDEIQLRQAQVRRQQLENQIRLEVENALLSLQRARASFDAAVETRQLQEEALDAEQQRYEVGASTTFMVIQYQRDLAQARSSEVVTQGNYAKAIAALERATGQTLDTYKVSMEDAYRGQVSKKN